MTRFKLGTWAACVCANLLCMTPAVAQDYFDYLVNRPEHLRSVALDSEQAVIDAAFATNKSKVTTRYDSAMDAARFIVKSNLGSVAIADQARTYFPYTDSGNLLVYWEALIPEYWARNGDVDGVKTYKAFQLSRDERLALEFRFRFSQVNRPYVARTDVRVYGNQAGVEIGLADSAAPQAREFNIRPNTWTSFWALVDFDNNKLSYWVGDANQGVTKVLDEINFNWRQNYGSRYGFEEFWFEFNTSQERSGPEAYHFGRNFAVLKNVADADDIVAQGDVVRPNPPELQ
ncbi:MAG: hypothetical protein AAFX44_12085 [Pseudomonadota bacterium]